MSYDTPDIVAKKAQYVISNGLAGSMFWDVSAGFVHEPFKESTSLMIAVIALDGQDRLRVARVYHLADVRQP